MAIIRQPQVVADVHADPLHVYVTADAVLFEASPLEALPLTVTPGSITSFAPASPLSVPLLTTGPYTYKVLPAGMVNVAPPSRVRVMPLAEIGRAHV